MANVNPCLRGGLVLTLLLASAGGCTQTVAVNAFDGADRAAGEIATMNIDPQIRLTSVDGKPVAGIAAGHLANDSWDDRVARLLPGTHTIVAGERARAIYAMNSETLPDLYGGSAEDQRIEFDALGGRSYALKFKRDDRWQPTRWWVEVIETSGGKRMVSKALGSVPYVPPQEKLPEDQPAPGKRGL